jgi:hypothetical protein
MLRWSHRRRRPRAHRSVVPKSRSACVSTSADGPDYLGCFLRSREAGRPRPQASAAERNAMATASSRRRAIASSVLCRTATLFRIVHPERPETVGGRSASPGERTDQLRGCAEVDVDPPRTEYGRAASATDPERSTSSNTVSASGTAMSGQLTSATAGAVGAMSVCATPARAKSAAARSSPESKALPSPNHSSSGTWPDPFEATVAVLITAT